MFLLMLTNCEWSVTLKKMHTSVSAAANNIVKWAHMFFCFFVNEECWYVLNFPDSLESQLAAAHTFSSLELLVLSASFLAGCSWKEWDNKKDILYLV